MCEGQHDSDEAENVLMLDVAGKNQNWQLINIIVVVPRKQGLLCWLKLE